MIREDGNRASDVWLLGDSNPKRWEDILHEPLDSRHPIRHNIWTSIVEVMQNKVFDDFRNHIDTTKIYVRNAIEDADRKPKRNDENWNDYVENEIRAFKNMIIEYKPKIVITFGSFAFEFTRRSIREDSQKPYQYWTTKKLGNEFRDRLDRFNVRNTNIIPLLHRSIAGRRYIQSHNYFCNVEMEGNYFNYAGKELANVLISNEKELDVWKI